MRTAMRIATRVLLVAAITLQAAGAAWSAESVLGRITYIYPDRHHLMLDNSTTYVLGSHADVSSLMVAELVKLTLERQNVRPVVARVSRVD